MTLKEEFIELLKMVKRDGIDELMFFLENSDFFKAPASTRFHGSYEEGLVEHSLEVYKNLYAKMTEGNTVWTRYYKEQKESGAITDESLIIIALLHDICKANMYTVEYRNKKSYEEADIKAADPKQIKQDTLGKFVWINAPSYSINEEEPLGHGDKSVIIASRYIRLTPEEEMAIRWHMGLSVPKEEYRQASAAMEKYPIVLATFQADMESSAISVV